MMLRRRRKNHLLALAIGALFAVLVAGTVQAGCYGGNLGGWRADSHTSTSKGIRAVLDHRSATPLNSNTAIVHPTQIDGYGSATDFLGWGTVKGVGVPGTSCDDNFTSSWDVYVDGVTFGVYFCNQTWGSVSNTAQNVRLTIQHMPSCNGGPRWGMYWDGQLQLCKTIDATAGQGSAGAESIGTTATQDLEIEYEGLQYRRASDLAWVNWAPTSSCTNSGYVLTIIGPTEHWIELA
jgi:hypothetical protein